jgi:hypothetical protein
MLAVNVHYDPIGRCMLSRGRSRATRGAGGLLSQLTLPATTADPIRPFAPVTRIRNQASAFFRLLNVTEYRRLSDAGILCSHCSRTTPRSR